MSQTWSKFTHVKVHEGCGGLVRWVEAVDTPGVQYTGHCLGCGAENVPMERIIPIEFGVDDDLRDAIREMDKERRANLRWVDDDDFDANQARLRAAVGGA